MHEYLLPFVEYAGMKKEYTSVQPTFKVPNRNTIKKDIFEMYDLDKLNMTKLTNGNDSRIVVTTNMWTSNHYKKCR
ncbi:hypothetical protein Ahy_A07g032606 [Arachis hypogaea]|uniref:Uncharacterized protein n=1 Tax=Arachis hypogaea TaxID=3818 RepID=A0A445C7B6_ARAHY|nr:hypothetical protein Ahy_A07g032606 [Arachis hypogaea]